MDRREFFEEAASARLDILRVNLDRREKGLRDDGGRQT
jgi:hypothetical protein